MLNPKEFNLLVEKLPSISIVQDGEGNLSFPGATPEQLQQIEAILATFDPVAEQAVIEAKKQQYRDFTNTARNEATNFETLLTWDEAKFRQWLVANGTEEALVMAFKVLKFIIRWIQAAERWSGTLGRLRG